MVSEWFCQVMGSEVGPLDQRQLVDMVRHHQINPEDLVRRDNSAWVPAFQVKGLFEAASKPASRPKPTAAQVAPPVEKASVDSSKTKPLGHKSLASRPAKQKRRVEPSHPVDESSQNATDWFCIASGEKQGPIGFDELKSMAATGKLRDRDRVWRAAWPKFQIAREVEGLHAPAPSD